MHRQCHIHAPEIALLYGTMHNPVVILLWPVVSKSNLHICLITCIDKYVQIYVYVYVYIYTASKLYKVLMPASTHIHIYVQYVNSHINTNTCMCRHQCFT